MPRYWRKYSPWNIRHRVQLGNKKHRRHFLRYKMMPHRNEHDMCRPLIMDTVKLTVYKVDSHCIPVVPSTCAYVLDSVAYVTNMI